jgi:hypothetical protein
VRDAIQRGIDAGVIANEFGRLYFIHRDPPTESK